MKKSVLLGIATLAMAATATTASAQEVTYVPDCSQGLLLNKNADNWFITAQGGANMLLGYHDVHADIKNRIGGNAGLYLGKWVSPVFGFRFGATFKQAKGATTADGEFRNLSQGAINDAKTFYPEKWMGLGPEFDVLVNLTNWWCGYRPGRVYNAVAHGGANAYWRWYKGTDVWHRAHVTNLSANVGLQNNFRLSDVVTIFLDVQYEILDFTKLEHNVQLAAGLTFNLGKSDWNCPVTAVCPTWKYTDAEGDALVARLNSAENQISDLQNPLDAARKRPVATRSDCEGLCTVYYPINQATLSTREKTILRSMAGVMQDNPNTTYILTGWADNYTGSDDYNVALRNRRVEGVKNFLVQCGVNESQLKAGIDNGNLTDFGSKGAPLDRAVTIRVAD
ncbi:MAG: OmpA family protein [Muribaculaceae bacterium]|nr:OmpA family protein [Muribaculaceae bacterium]